MEGQFQKNKLSGFARVFYPSGHYYLGMCKDNKPQGMGRLVYFDGKIEEGFFKNG